MSKTIRDLFTQEEWEALAEDILPRLGKIAALPLIDKEGTEDETE